MKFYPIVTLLLVMSFTNLSCGSASSRNSDEEDKNTLSKIVESEIDIQKQSSIQIINADNNNELLHEMVGVEASSLLQNDKDIIELKIKLYDNVAVKNEDLINCLNDVNFSHVDSINAFDYMSCIGGKYENKLLCGINKNINFKSDIEVLHVSISVHY